MLCPVKWVNCGNIIVVQFPCSPQGQSEAAQLLATFWPRQMQEIRNMNTVSTLKDGMYKEREF